MMTALRPAGSMTHLEIATSPDINSGDAECQMVPDSITQPSPHHNTLAQLGALTVHFPGHTHL